MNKDAKRLVDVVTRTSTNDDISDILNGDISGLIFEILQDEESCDKIYNAATKANANVNNNKK